MRWQSLMIGIGLILPVTTSAEWVIAQQHDRWIDDIGL
jgi:hypothetical protein